MGTTLHPAAVAPPMPTGTVGKPEVRPGPTERERWRELALAALRKDGRAGADTRPEDVERLLTSTIGPGIAVGPLYGPGDARSTDGLPGQSPYLRGGRAPGTPWQVRQRHGNRDAAATCAAIRADLAGGVDSLWLTVGPEAIDLSCLPEVLGEIDLRAIDVLLDAGHDVEAAAAVLLAQARRQAVAPTALTGTLGVDPLGLYARTGVRAERDSMLRVAALCAPWPGLRAITVDATVSHDAGADDADELACSVATGVAYLRELVDAGLGIGKALRQLEFRYAATVDQFATIAKLRAARRLWARVAHVCGAGDAAAQRQHAVTSSLMLTIVDRETNLLRTTVAAFAAAVGGADTVSVQPFDAALGVPDERSRRIASNTSAVLREEARLAQVSDPGGGAWYIESLTETLAQRAWQRFTEIERGGGMLAALDSGLVAGWFAASWQERARDVAHRRRTIVGLSDYPDLAPAHQPEGLARSHPAAPGTPVAGLPRHRDAESFERLHARAQQHATVQGRRPAVFLVPLGAPAARAARLAFTAHLFAAGGVSTVEGPAVAPAGRNHVSSVDVERMTQAFAASGATVACLCGPNAAYVEAGSLTQALVAAGAARVWVAGPPGDNPGHTDYLFTGCDAVEVLSATLADLGVA